MWSSLRHFDCVDSQDDNETATSPESDEERAFHRPVSDSPILP